MRSTLFFQRYSSGKYTWRDVYGEVLELVEALLKGDVQEAREEFWDVALAAQGLAHTHGWSFTMIMPMGHLVKFARRRKVWERIFRKEGLLFDTKYWVAGSNHKKPAKVTAALSMARADQ